MPAQSQFRKWEAHLRGLTFDWHFKQNVVTLGLTLVGSPPGHHGPLVRYIKLLVEHAPGMPGTFSPPLRVRDPTMHHGMCTMHVPRCMWGSLTSDFLWSQWWGNRSQHSCHMPNPHGSWDAVQSCYYIFTLHVIIWQDISAWTCCKSFS